MKNINDWVAKYNYFDFTDKEGIRGISHELLRDIIEKCIELEERIEKLEPTEAHARLENLAKERLDKLDRASLEPLTIEELVENSPMVTIQKLKRSKPKKKTNE